MSRLRGVRAAWLIPTRANNQPAFGYYLQDPQVPIVHAHGLIVLTLESDQISAITRFGNNSVFPTSGCRASTTTTPHEKYPPGK
ncbi:MAG TPA: hypothetical protein VIV12_25725, partial [Streptosporangiaceae bacterium]